MFDVVFHITSNSIVAIQLKSNYIENIHFNEINIFNTMETLNPIFQNWPQSPISPIFPSGIKWWSPVSKRKPQSQRFFNVSQSSRWPGLRFCELLNHVFQLKLPSLFTAWLFSPLHFKSHNMKALVILSHSGLPFSWEKKLPPDYLWKTHDHDHQWAVYSHGMITIRQKKMWT